MQTPPDSIGTDVLFEASDHIARVRLNRPARRNAVNGGITSALSWLCRHADASDDIRVVVLESATPGMFCAGADLGVIAAGGGAEMMDDFGGFAGFVRAPRATPWIAVVDGPALGGGCELAIACDMVVASHAARFGLPEVQRGLYAAGGGAFRIASRLPPALANELLATGEPMAAADAQAHGLINRVADPAEVSEMALALARRIAANAPLAVRESLRMARIAGGDEAGLWRESDAAMMRVLSSEDAREGPRAFMEKRAPSWSGR